MKNYAIEIFFDQAFDDYVCELWRECEERQFSSFMNRVKGTEPHIALAVYENVDRNKLEEKFKTFIDQEFQRFMLIFDAVSIFPTTAVTYLQPNATTEFMDLMIRTHKFFEEYNKNCKTFYTPRRWFPHVSVGKNKSLEEGKRTACFVIDQFTPQIVQVERLALVEIEYIEDEIICRNLLVKELN